jgi:hypothetical protein
VEIARLERPTPADFQSAAAICETRWPFLRPLHTPQRFRAFERLGVELIIARQGGRFEGVCFALPCRHDLGGDVVEWVNLFQLATRPEAKNVGGLLMLRIMSLYPTAVSLGVTAEATRMYVAMRWKRYDDVWRCVHPVDMRRLAADYGERLTRPWTRATLKHVAGAYNAGAGALETIVGLGAGCESWNPASAPTPALRAKAEAMAASFDLLSCGPHTRAVNVGGTARVLDSYREGWGTLRAHAGLWRELRRRGAKLCEVLATTPEAKSRSRLLGYAPLPMPLWYTDKNGMGSRLVEALKRNDVSFFHTDKTI